MFFGKMIHLQLTLFFLIIIGIYMKKRKIITEAGQKVMSDLMINLILPCNIIVSFMGEIEISEEFVKNCGYAFLISLVIQILSILFVRFLFGRYEKDKRQIFSYGLIVSNSSFIGIPIIGALYGEMGILYTSLFQIPVRITMWTSGLSLFTDIDRKAALKKIVVHPCIMSIGIGIILMASDLELPQFVSNTLTYVSNCTIPVSMLAIGAMFSECKVGQLLDKSILYYSVIRLIVYPLLVLFVLKALGFDQVLTNVMVLLTGMPMAGTTAILADKYGGNSKLAAQTIFVSTLLSIATLPVIYGLAAGGYN